MDARERRMTYRVTSEWVGLKRNKPFPSIDFLHPRTFSVDWDSCVLVHAVEPGVEPEAATLEFEFVGKHFRKDAPGCAAGTVLAAVPPQSLLSLSTPVILRMFERSTAVIYNGIQPWDRARAVYFRTIAVPFGTVDGTLKYALSGVSYKLANEQVGADKAYTEFLEFRNGSWLPIDGPGEEVETRRLATA